MNSCCREVYARAKARKKSIIANGIALSLGISYDPEQRGLFASDRPHQTVRRGSSNVSALTDEGSVRRCELIALVALANARRTAHCLMGREGWRYANTPRMLARLALPMRAFVCQGF